MRFEVDRVSLRFRGPPPVDALREVTLTISRGERLALMGSSGSGKSSLLRVLAGLEAPTGGRVRRDGEDITALEPWQRGVGMVPQDAPLYEHLSVLDNTAHPLRTRGAAAADARRDAMAMLERVGLSARAHARGGEISGGERRRAALARALVTKPALLLLDEPFASLEPELRLVLRDEVRALCRDAECACVHATHDGLEALALGTSLAVLDRGRLVDLGTPDRIWSAPASPASARLVGAVPMNLVESSDAHGAPRLVGVRPEHLRIAADPRGSHDGRHWFDHGVVLGIESLGDRRLVSIRADGGRLLRAVVERGPDDAPDALREGAAVAVTAPREALVEFPHPETAP